MLAWIIKGATKKNAPRPGGQPWDAARRRQSLPASVDPDQEITRPSRPFPNFQDLGKEIREVLLEVDDELLSEPTYAERNKEYRFKTVSEVKAPVPIISKPPVSNRVHFEETTIATNVRNPIYHPELSLSPQAVVQGIIMSEILQPPRAKRPFRH